MQPEPSLSQEPQTQSPVKKEKKKSPLLAILFVIVLLALIGVGYWGYSQSAQLKATKAELSTLQGNYESLTTEKKSVTSELESVKAELEAAKADLEKAKSDLGAAQTDLSKSKSNASALREKMDKAAKYVGIMTSMFSDNDALAALAKMTETKDAELQKLFTTYATSGNPADMQKWLAYIFDTLADLLK